MTFANDIDCLPQLSGHLAKAWLHFQMGITLIAKAAQPMGGPGTTHYLALSHFERFAQLLEDADERITDQLRTIELRESECCKASGVFWLVFVRLNSDDVGEGVDVGAVYKEHLNVLVRPPECFGHLLRRVDN